MLSMFYKIETKMIGLMAMLLLSSSILVAQFQVNAVNTNVSCFGLCNGSATANATGGVTPYSYAWSNGSTLATIANQCAGTYNVVVTDATGATRAASAIITQPVQLGVQVATSDQICGLNPAGTATATPSDGTAPYAYTWSTGATTAQITSLVAGNYTVTTTDARGCTAAATGNVIFSNEGIWMMDSIAGVQCAGQSNGYLSVSPMSGSMPYTYAWSNGGTTKSISGLAPGFYTVTVTEAGGCTATRTFQIQQPSTLALSTTNTNAFCGATATASASASGGTGAFTYTWSNGSTGATVTGLAAGTYTVTAYDANGCASSKTLTVQSSGGAVAAAIQLTTAVGCNSNGTITASGSGGSGTYSYAWSNGANTASASVGTGVYIVTVTDGAGCQGTSSINVTGPSAPALTASVTSQATCSTGGTASVSISNGNGPYTYLWDNSQTTASATNLSAGTHIVTVTNASGCTATATVNITAPQSPSVTATITQQASCSGGGSAIATATGGTAPYTYIWSSGATTATATGLAAGTRTVTVTDANGCGSSASINMTSSGGALAATATITTALTCTGNGTITANATGGTGTLTYQWSGSASTSATLSVSAAGTYTVTVSNAAGGCTGTASVTVNPATNLISSAAVVGTPACNGTTLRMTPTGGVSPFTYAWSNGGTTQNITVTPAGTYTATVTDAAGCTSTSIAVFSLPAAPNVSVSSSSNATCNQGGSTTVAASGGTAPYTYTWSNGATGATVTNLAAGTYTVTASGANGCSKTTSVTIGFTNNGVQVGDFVWLDIDQDGFNEVGEAPQANIHVMLMTAGPDGLFGTADDVTVARDTTNAMGNYLFDCVTPGTYVIMFSNLPAGYQWAAKDNVNNDCKDSDANAGGKTAPFTIVPGSGNNLCIDAGLHVLCSNVTFAGTIGNDQTICEGDVPQTITPNGPPLGGTGAFEYVWMTYDPVQLWVGIPNTNSASYNPGQLFVTSRYMRCIRRAGCVVFLESNIVTITVKPAGSPGCTQFLTSFTVGGAPNQAIAVEWTVPSEMPNLKYLVQHSQNQIDWETVKTVFGAPSGSSSAVSYQYMHTVPQMGDNYFRILRVTETNAVSYSDVRMYDMHMQPLTVYPNPSLSSSKIFMRNNMAKTDDITIEVFDVNGRLMSTTTMLKDLMGDEELPTNNLAAGFYYIRVMVGGESVQTTELLRY